MPCLLVEAWVYCLCKQNGHAGTLRIAAPTYGNYSLDDALLRLPHSQYSHTQAAEEESAMKSQRPKYGFVVLLALKDIPRVLKDNVIPIYVVCKHARILCNVVPAKNA